MFLGTYRPKVIGARRIALPKKIRKGIKGRKVVLTIGFEECIFGFDREDWNKIVRPELERPLFSDTEGRDLRRKMCTEAMEVELGTEGRFVIPENMIEFAKIGNKLVLIGAGDHFEIWDDAKWEIYSKKLKGKSS